MPTFDDFIPFLGEFGSYQKRVLLYACILVIPTGAHIFAQIFLGARTDHWCSNPPQWKSDNCSQWSFINSSTECDSAKKTATIPPGAQCSRYDLEYDIVDFSPDLVPTETTNETTVCLDGWIHDRKHYTSTIVQDVRTSNYWMWDHIWLISFNCSNLSIVYNYSFSLEILNCK